VFWGWGVCEGETIGAFPDTGERGAARRISGRGPYKKVTLDNGKEKAKTITFEEKKAACGWVTLLN